MATLAVGRSEHGAGTGGRQPRRRRPLVHRGEEIRCTWCFEEEAWAAGLSVVGGLDEVGRGALCGPVLAGAVVLGRGFDASGLDDSKRLTEAQREALASRVQAGAEAWAVGRAEPAEIDRLNIRRATHLAMTRALEALGRPLDLLLVDGREQEAPPGLAVPHRPIVKGDARSFSIAAASVVAKVARDGIMREYDRRFPGYGLGRNMGYGSEEHREALHRLGPCEIHRRSFQGTERWLF